MLQGILFLLFFPSGSLQLPSWCSWRLPLVAVLTCLNSYGGSIECGYLGDPPPTTLGISPERIRLFSLCVVNIINRQSACHNKEEWWKLGWITDVNVEGSVKLNQRIWTFSFCLSLNHAKFPYLRGPFAFIGHQDGEVVWSNCRCDCWAKLNCQELKRGFSVDWSLARSTRRIYALWSCPGNGHSLCGERISLHYVSLKPVWKRGWVSSCIYVFFFFFWLMVYRKAVITECFWFWTTAASLSDFWDVDTKGLDELSSISYHRKWKAVIVFFISYR